MYDKTIEEIIDLYDSAQEERKTTKEPEYWQGRKDGLRLALAILQPEEEHWKLLNQSSYGFRIEEREMYKNFLDSVFYDLCDLIYSIRHKEKPHSLTVSNLQNWLGTYMIEQKTGFVKSAPNAINPFE
jgi:hypothetical protein